MDSGEIDPNIIVNPFFGLHYRKPRNISAAYRNKWTFSGLIGGAITSIGFDKYIGEKFSSRRNGRHRIFSPEQVQPEPH